MKIYHTTYMPTAVFTETLLGLTASDRGPQLWTPIKLRKPLPCYLCQTLLVKGANAWRPMTNKTNRYHRLCPACMQGLFAKIGVALATPEL